MVAAAAIDVITENRWARLAGVGLAASVWLWGDGLPASYRAKAQITPDESFGSEVNGSRVNSCLSATCTITGGTLNRSGSTLLHSFSEFSLGQALSEQLEAADVPPSAIFVDPGVNDIVVRVTGESASTINGVLGTSIGSHANLFFINPEGISFGPAARLDLGGAFVASTANNILFSEGIVLSADDPTPATHELLTVSAPIGLGFLSSQPSERISVAGTGNRLFFGSPEDPSAQFINRALQRPPAPPPGIRPGQPPGRIPESPPLPPISKLAVQFGDAIALIGNGVELTGGNLTAPGGKIELGSVESGRVLFNADSFTGDSFTGDSFADYSQVSQFSDIILSDRSILEVSAASPGSIRLQGQDLSILGSSAILAEPLPPLPNAPDKDTPATGGLIDLQAQGAIRVSGANLPSGSPFQPPFRPPFRTYLSVNVAPGAIAAQGLLNIRSRNLSIDEGAQIGANTFGTGDAGQIQINVDDTLSIGTGSFLGPSGLFASTGTQGSSNSGQIQLKAGHLLMTDGGQILTSSLNGGAAGSVSVEADRISLIGTGLVEIPQPDGSTITAGGPTSIQSAMGPASSGQGATLLINADQILVTEGASISTATFGSGEAGKIDISSQAIEVSGFSVERGPSSILTTVAPNATGDGGDLEVKTDRLQVLGGGQVRAGTLGSGMSGDLTVSGESVLISGQTDQGRSGLFADAVGGTGAGGNLTISANTVDVADGATLNVSNFPSQENSPFPPGQGAAGDLRVSADRISLSGQSLVNAGTAAGDRGNITLETDLLTLRDGSDITTDAIHSSSGGNITIDAADGFVIAVPDENSDITANAVFGDGGRVSVDAQQVLGLRVRPELTSQSDITASSEFGVAGEIQLAQVNTDLRSEPTELPQSTEVPALAQGCSAADGSTIRFIQSGRGGVGTNPYDVLNSRDSLSDVSIPGAIASPAAESSEVGPSADSPELSVVEAENWAVNDRGEVMLLAVADGGRCLDWRS